MSKATFIPHINDEPHADESDWRSVVDLLEQHASDLGVQLGYVSAVMPVLTALSGGSIVARLDVTDPAKPIQINVTSDGIKINTVDRPTITREP